MNKLVAIFRKVIKLNILACKTFKLRYKYYSKQSPRALNNKKIVVIMVDGRCPHGGFADRLKGITTVYLLSKQLGYDFRINYSHPFNLEKIYAPNLHDWRIDPSELCYNPIDTHVSYLMGVSNNIISPEATKEKLINILKTDTKQIHIYTNTSYALYETTYYKTLYNELFKISDSFNCNLTPYMDQLGLNYICVGARFAGSLGGFKDAYKELCEASKTKLIEATISKIEEIHSQHADLMIYLATDSNLFAKEASKLNYIITLQEDRTHTDKKVVENDNFNALKGTFIDFIIASKSSMIFQIKGDGMYAGGFTYSASHLNDTPYKLLKF